MPVVRDNQLTDDVDPRDVDYEMLSPARQSGTHINSIPIQSAVQAPRLFYGARFLTQADSLVHREAPWVQNLDPEDPDGRSFDQILGASAGAIFADDDYEVVSSEPGLLTLRDSKGNTVEKRLYTNLPQNRKSSLKQRPVVQAGQRVKRGEPLVVSNFTDDKGTLAMGVNATVGLVPYLGYSMDDAVVVSDSFAKRLRSQRMKAFKFNRTDSNLRTGRDHYVALMPSNFTKEQLKNIDADGVVKPGTVLQPGDPVILATKPRVLSSQSAQLGKLSKVSRELRTDASVIWDGSYPATVSHVGKTKKGFKVIADYEADAAPGDKIVMRSGGKGTIAEILPDDRMPRTVQGQPIEALFNQLTLPSRANASGYMELALGKVAAVRKQAIKLPGFTKKNEYWIDIVEKALKDAGLSDAEEVFDPVLNRKLERPISVGNQYILKLHHTSESKAASRGTGSYTLDEQPARGGYEGAKRWSGLENAAMASSGAYATLREGATLTGQRNDEYWRLLRAGYKPPEPGRPFVWNKFMALLGGAGINVRDVGHGKLRLAPFTDTELDRRGAIEVKSADTVDFNSLEPKAGGLFDKALVSGQKWGYVKLPEPVANPAYEDTIRHLLGLKMKDLQAILAGDMPLPPELLQRLQQHRKAAAAQPVVDSSIPTTGPQAIAAALGTVDLDELEKQQQSVLASGRVSKRRDAVKALHAIAGLRRNEAKPTDLMLNKLPVLPPAFRPYTVMGDVFVPGKANELYKDFFDIKQAFETARKSLGDRNVSQERASLQDAVRAVYGYRDPVTAKSQQRNASGFLQQIVGTNAKFGWVQRKLLSKTQDQVSRGVITPNPELTLDEIGLPEDMAWGSFRNFIQRRLVRQGLSRMEAMEAIRDRTPVAKKALEKELEERYVVYARSPAWHRTNVVSGKAVLIPGHTIQISPLVAAGMNADYDGDQINVHVPATDEALEEARTILRPSHMLFSIKDQERLVPELKHEQVLGLFAATQRPAQKIHRFASAQEAIAAIEKGLVSLSDDIEIPD